MPFIGTLRNNEIFTLDVTPATGNGGSIAITASYMTGANRIRDIDILTVTNGSLGAAISRQMPKDTIRAYFEIDLPNNGLAQARVTQGAEVHTADVGLDARLIFDVV